MKMGRQRGMMEMIEPDDKKQSGCYVSLTKGFLMLLMLMVLCIGIGVIVHFAEKNRCKSQPKTQPDYTTTTEDLTTTEVPSTTKKVPQPSKDQFLVPVKYLLEFEPEHPSTAGSTFRGFLELEIKCFNQTSALILDSQGLIVDNSSVRIRRTTDTKTIKFHQEIKKETIQYTLAGEYFESGNNYVLSMNYTGTISFKGSGVSAMTNQKQITDIIFTNFEPKMARRAFPCFDEPGIKAVFQVTVVRKSNLTSISNMELEKQFNRSNDMVADVYKPTPMMSTYLLAFVICDYKYVNRTLQNGTLARVYYPDNFKMEAQKVLDFSVKVLDHFSNLFGVSYSLPKLDLFPIDNFPHAGMENWGLILMSTRYMLFNPNKVSAAKEAQYLSTIVHEIVHQWIGNLVTVDDWKYIWMTEGLTEYLSLREIRKIHSSFKGDKNQLYQARLKALDNKQSSLSYSLSSSSFSRLAYEESAMLFMMLDSMLGEANFNAAIKLFLMKYKGSSFQEDEFWNCMSASTSISVRKFMKPWVLQKNYPLVTATKNNSSMNLVIKQEPFLIFSVLKKVTEKKDKSWPIPYTFMEYSKSHSKSSPLHYLDEQETKIPSVQSEWFIVNINSSGFYRVNYDTQNWQNLIKQLNTDHKVISAVDRATLISDAWALTRAKLIKPEIFVSLIDYMDKENSYIPWIAFSKIFDEFYYLSQESEEMPIYLNYFQQKIKEIYQRIGWESGTAMTFEERILQGVIINLACHVEYPHCISKAVQLYHRWKKNPDEYSINPNYRFIVLCAGIREGNRRDCEFLNQRLETGDASENFDIRMALTCANQPWILKSHLENVVKSESLSQKELTTIIAYIARNPVGTSIVKAFLDSKCQFNDSIAVGTGDMSVPCVTVAKSVTDLVDYDILHLKDAKYISDSYHEHLLEINFLKESWVIDSMPAGAKWLKKHLKKTTITNWRLPNDLKPMHYIIELKPDIYLENATDFYSEGWVKIEIACLNSTQNILLHSQMLNISNISVVVASEVIPVLETSHDDGNEMLTIRLAKEIRESSNVTLKMEFRGPIKNDLMGLYYSTYKKGEKTIYLATTQFEPTSARKAFPCFDEPQMKATYDVILLRKSNYKSISNMPIKYSENRSDDYIADFYETTPIMSTYLLAFIVCDFVRETKITKFNTEVGIWTKDSSVSHNKLALNSSVVILEHYAEVFAYPYPLPKEDVIAIPDFAYGAMENWGLITYREVALLYDSNYPSIKQEQYVVLVVAHELAHQWFGNLVTMCWWNDIWLNEGFATFVEYIGMNYFRPEWKIFDYFVVDVVQRALKADGSLSSHPLDVPSGHSIALDDISYQKGASVIRMMEFFLGDSIFKKGLQRYIRKHAYGNAANKDLWAAFTEEAIAQNETNLDVGNIMKEWIMEMNYPVIFVKWQGSNIVISQKRFLFEKNTHNCKNLKHVIWKVPFTFTTSKDLNFEKTSQDIEWLFENEKIIPVNQTKGNDDWILGNTYQRGFYRVNYEKENWQKLIQLLLTNHTKIPPANRAQIIDDAWSLAEAEMLDDYTALDVLNYLQYERDDVPMTAAYKQVMFIRTMFYEKADYGCFEEYMQHILRPSFSYVRYRNNTLFQSTIFAMACKFNLPECISLVNNYFQDWKVAIRNNQSNPLKNDDIMFTVFCTGVYFGNKDDWFLIHTTYLNTNDAAERRRLIYALGCTQKLWLLQTFLKAAIEMKDFRRQDFRDVAYAISRNPAGKNLLWKYVQKNWDELVDNHGQSILLPSMIKAATMSFNNQYQLEELEYFMDNRPMLGVGKEAFESALDKTRVNIRWMARNEKVIKTWLHKQNFTKRTCAPSV